MDETCPLCTGGGGREPLPEQFPAAAGPVPLLSLLPRTPPRRRVARGVHKKLAFDICVQSAVVQPRLEQRHVGRERAEAQPVHHTTSQRVRQRARVRRRGAQHAQCVGCLLCGRREVSLRMPYLQGR